MVGKSQKYLFNVAILKDYGGVKRKLTKHKILRQKGLECGEERKYVEKGTVNDKKLDENISRAKSRIFEYAYCNEWSWFVTLTINGAKYDRKDLNGYYAIFNQWFRNYQKKYRIELKDIFIPELHDDEVNWHLHGLIQGLPQEHLRAFTLDEKLPDYIRGKILKNEPVYDWSAYREKFGWTTIEPIRNKEAAAKYITKYVTKDLSKSVTELNAHLYYCSKGLKKAEIKKKGSLRDELNKPDFENEYVQVKWYDSNVPLNKIEKLFCD